MSKKMVAGASGVDNTHRKKWDRSQFADQAKERDKKEKEAEDSALDVRKRKRLERDPLHQGLIVARANLQARDFQIDLSSKLNKSQVQSVAMPLSQQAGYYCNVCECVLKDSLAYLDHINGKWHNRSLGMSMRVEQSTVEQVRSRLDELKRRKKEGGGDQAGADHVPDGLSREVLEKEAKQARLASGATPGEGEDEAEEGDQEDEDSVDPEFAAMMGFGGFGGSKKG